jgi:pimeloyl-ACP methyl ester carboxylesterase
VAIVPVPFKLAVFDPFVANPVIRENRYIRSWAIGGHSLGGAMAARFVYQDSTACKGLILYAAYPDGSNDLSKRGIPVLSISGSLDGLATPTTIENNKKYLPAPPQTRYVVLEGANHAQYGNYGKQNRDNDATMSYSEQQRRTVEETVRFLNTLK